MDASRAQSRASLAALPEVKARGVLSLVMVLSLGGTEAWTPPIVALEQVGTTEWRSSDSPEVRVVMKNDGAACRPIFITGTYFGVEADRPMTWLEFEVTDPSGKRLAPVWPEVLRPRYNMADLLLLHCGTSYSWRISLGRDGWGYRFRPGAFKVRARAKNRIADFFDRRPTERQRLMTVFELDPVFGGELLGDFETTSNEIEIVVGR